MMSYCHNKWHKIGFHIGSENKYLTFRIKKKCNQWKYEINSEFTQQSTVFKTTYCSLATQKQNKKKNECCMFTHCWEKIFTHH